MHIIRHHAIAKEGIREYCCIHENAAARLDSQGFFCVANFKPKTCNIQKNPVTMPDSIKCALSIQCIIIAFSITAWMRCLIRIWQFYKNGRLQSNAHSSKCAVRWDLTPEVEKNLNLKGLKPLTDPSNQGSLKIVGATSLLIKIC